MRISYLLTAAVVVCVFSGVQARVEEDRYLDVVRGYADAMLAHGRDTYGRVQSPLIASALDRKGLGLLKSTPPAPEGVRDGDRTLTGSNMMHYENLLRLLIVLTDLTGDKRYARAADEACGFFFTHCQSKATGLMAWGEHLGWDFQTDSVLRGRDIHEYYRPWVLWDRCYALAPKACEDFARGVWEHQIADHNTGNFNRHARFDRHGPERDKEFSRHAGFYIATWAALYGKTKDPEFVRAVEVLMDSFERRRSSNGRFPGIESEERPVLGNRYMGGLGGDARSAGPADEVRGGEN